MVNLSFCCLFILYSEKVTSYQKFSDNLTLEVQIVLKIIKFPKLSIKIKILKTFCKAETASYLKEII